MFFLLATLITGIGSLNSKRSILTSANKNHFFLATQGKAQPVKVHAESVDAEQKKAIVVPRGVVVANRKAAARRKTMATAGWTVNFNSFIRASLDFPLRDEQKRPFSPSG